MEIVFIRIWMGKPLFKTGDSPPPRTIMRPLAQSVGLGVAQLRRDNGAVLAATTEAVEYAVARAVRRRRQPPMA